MNKIFEEFNTLVDEIQNLFGREEYGPIKAGIRLFANIVFSDIKKNNSVVLFITQNKQKVYRGYSTSTGLSLIGHSKVWKEILSGEKSLSTCFAEGTIKVPNLRVNWSKLWSFSSIIKNVKNFS